MMLRNSAILPCTTSGLWIDLVVVAKVWLLLVKLMMVMVIVRGVRVRQVGGVDGRVSGRIVTRCDVV